MFNEKFKTTLDFRLYLWYCVVLQELAIFMDIIKELWCGKQAPCKHQLEIQKTL